MFGGNDSRRGFTANKDDSRFLALQEEIEEQREESPITKMEVLGHSINSCIKQDEEFSNFDSHIKNGSGNLWSECYEFRPESFDVKLLSGTVPKKVINFLSRKNQMGVDGDCRRRVNYKALSSHSIFYIYCGNELIFWNWTKEDSMYSVQTEEFFLEDSSKEKAQIRCVGVYEREDSVFFLVSTETYLILLELVWNPNGNYLVNRIRDSFYSLASNGYEKVRFCCITVHQASGRFFLGCEETGNVFEFEFPPLHGSYGVSEYSGVRRVVGDIVSCWIGDKMKRISGAVGIGSFDSDSGVCSLQNYVPKISRLVCLTRNLLLNKVMPEFLRNFLFGRSESSVVSIHIDDDRGFIYALYGNSDIDVFVIPMGSICISKISNDFTFFQRKIGIDSSSFYFTSHLPVKLLFRVSFKALMSELGRQVLTNSNRLPSSSVGAGLKKSRSDVTSETGIGDFSVHSIHSVNPQESESVLAIFVTSNGDRIYMEGRYDLFASTMRKDKNKERVSFKLPIGLKVGGFRRSPLSGSDDPFEPTPDEHSLSSVLYSNGVFIQAVLSRGEKEFRASPENERATVATATGHYDDPLVFSSIIVTCLDQTAIARRQIQTGVLGGGSCVGGSGRDNDSSGNGSLDNKSTGLPFREWKYVFSDPNLGVILDIQERDIATGYQRLFDNLWNAPNPYRVKGGEREEGSDGRALYETDFFLVRPNVSDAMLDGPASCKSGFGAKISGSRFYHLWRYFYNRVSEKRTYDNSGNRAPTSRIAPGESAAGQGTFDIIKKKLSSERSADFVGMGFPGSPQSGLGDLALDQTTQNRSWTVITTNGVFLLEKKKILDIITRMTLEPHNYSFMLNVFEEYDKSTGAEHYFGGDLLSLNKSAAFAMRLLGTFAQVVTFEQFFSVIWQGLVSLNSRGFFNRDIYQGMFSSVISEGMRGGESHVTKEMYLGNCNLWEGLNRQRSDFPAVTLVKIWTVLISDTSIQLGLPATSVCCNVRLNSLNCSIPVSPRCKGLVLLISRVLRSVWMIPLFQQTDFEIRNSERPMTPPIESDFPLYGFGLKGDLVGGDYDHTNVKKEACFANSWDGVGMDIDFCRESKMATELIKNQICELDEDQYMDVGEGFMTGKRYKRNSSSIREKFFFSRDEVPIKTSSSKGKKVVVDISSCVNEFFKPTASEWLSSSLLFSMEDSEERGCTSMSANKTGNKRCLYSSLIPENNTDDFSRNDIVTVTIKSSLEEKHIEHLISSLRPILDVLEVLLPSWFPNHNNSNSDADSRSSPLFCSSFSGSKQSSQPWSFSKAKKDGMTYHSSSCINISEASLFREIRSFVLKAIQVLKLVSLFRKTYPFGLKYSAYVTQENLICVTYLDLLKKSMLRFNLFNLIENKGKQFLVRLMFRYDLLSGSRFLSNCHHPDLRKEGNPLSCLPNEDDLLSPEIVLVENSVAQLNKVLVFCKKNNSLEKRIPRSSSQSVQFHKAKILSGNISHIPLNVVLRLLDSLGETKTAVNLILLQSEHLHTNGVFPLWVTNGVNIPIKTPISVLEYIDYIQSSNSFVQNFLEVLMGEINRSGQQYNSNIVTFPQISLSIQQSGCRTQLDYCKQHIFSNITRSIYTYEFHSIIWIYSNLQYLLDLKYSSYILEIESFLSSMDLFDDENFEYLDGFTISKKREIKSNDCDIGEVSDNNQKLNPILYSNKNKKSLQDGLASFSVFRDRILSIKSSIKDTITLALTQGDNLGTMRSKKVDHKETPSYREWLHYYLFSYVSYNDSCMKKTVYDEIKSRRSTSQKFEKWFVKNISITVFTFSEESPFLKNWLENYNMNDFYTVARDTKTENDRFCSGLDTKKQELDLEDGSTGDSKAKTTSGLVSKENEKNLISDQGYLLYNAKQYLSAGKYYYSRARVPWKIPLKSSPGSDLGIYEENVEPEREPILLVTSCGSENSSSFGSHLRRNIDFQRKKMTNTSMLLVVGGEKRVDDMYHLFIDIIEQILDMQQEPTLLQRRSLLLQSQTCIERDMNENKNKDLIRSIRNDLFNTETQMEILEQIIEYVHFYILSALEQNVMINPVVKEIFEIFGVENNKRFIRKEGNSVVLNKSDLESDIIEIVERNSNISREGIDIFKHLILGMFNIQSMIHSNNSLLEFMTDFYNLTGFSSVTEVKWLIDHAKNSSNDVNIYNLLGTKISSLFEFRNRQAYYYDTPIFFEMDIVSILHFSETNTRFSSQMFDSVIETLTLELYRFSVLYYNEFRKNDLVDIYDFETPIKVKSRVLWWVWPVKFLIFHLNNKSFISRLIPLFSGNSNNSSILFQMVGGNERVQLSQIIKDSLSNYCNESN